MPVMTDSDFRQQILSLPAGTEPEFVSQIVGPQFEPFSIQQRLEEFVDLIRGQVEIDDQLLGVRRPGVQSTKPFSPTTRFRQSKAQGTAEPEILLSWRVQLLPALGYGEPFEKFRLDEPWDSALNRQFIPQMPVDLPVAPGQVAQSVLNGQLRELRREEFVHPLLLSDDHSSDPSTGYAVGVDSWPQARLLPASLGAPLWQAMLTSKGDEWIGFDHLSGDRPFGSAPEQPAFPRRQTRMEPLLRFKIQQPKPLGN